MNKRWIPIVLIAVLAIIVLVVKLTGGVTNTAKKKNSGDVATTGKKVNRDRGFDRRTSFLKYSNHAECRMSCRKISKKEVEGIMRDGKINYNKSDIQHARCPRYAVEGLTSDGQRVRIVYAQCDESTTVVTAIDLGEDHECDCPGDDDKYNNKK